MGSITTTEPSGPPTSATGLPARPRPARWQVPAAAAGYLVYALFVTWPLVLDPGSSVFGGGGGDNWGQLAFLREFDHQGANPFGPGRLADIAAPEGLEVSYGLNLVTWPSTAMLLGLTRSVGAVAALNVFVIAGFVLNGTSMFLLARRVTAAPVAAFVAGFGLAFFPFVIVKAQVHQHYMHAWVFVLLAWRMRELSERPSARNGVLAGLAAVLAFSWTPYFALFGLAVYLPFVARDVSRVVRGSPLRPQLIGHATSGGVVLAAFSLYALVARSAPSSGSLPRPITEAYVYSSRPLELVLPDAQNPVFGGLTGDLLLEHAHGSGFSEFNGYLGLSLLALAAVALWAAVRKRLDPPQRSTVAVFAAVALAGVLLTAPPTANVGPLRLYFPAWVVFQVSDAFRAFSRAVVIIELGVCLLAAVGLTYLLRGRALSPVRRAGVLVGVTAIVAVDLFASAPTQNTRVPAPAVYTALKRLHPRGLVAEYPLLPAEVPDYEPALFQSLHGRPILNGYASGTDQEARALGLARLDDPRTPGRLRLLGVRHVVVDERPSGRPDSPPVAQPARGLDLLERAQGRAVYEITAPPARSAVLGGAGFARPQGEPPDQRQWATRADVTLLVAASCARCVGTVRFRVASVAEERTLVVRDARGARLMQTSISVNSPVAVEVPVRFARRTALRLEVEPGPRSPDPRTVGLLLRDAAFVARR